jgi:DNA-binding MarR family transcriptional regulator
MENAGYLSRRRDPRDERQVRISLTGGGRTAREKSFEFLDRLVKASNLPPVAYQQLVEGMIELRQNLLHATA